ncbi:MAG: putative NAD(P)H-dependent FMN-containing oxidoreductase YwqN [Chlamydiia bacterium]|nr:putative NAD(P)H-dependent FMN-containing oxidoreductase YwqN [Chlamydiia bacterium]
MKKAMVILGSARSEGNTRKAISELDPAAEFSFEDLNTLNISNYDYNHKNQDDDFLSLMERVLDHEVLIFATPVYWYVMSAEMKTFFDRLTDCVTIRKEIGKALAGKKVFLLASYSNPDLGDFAYPFEGTSNYFKMEYKGDFFHYSGKNEELLEKNSGMKEFRKLIDQELQVETT